MTTQDARTDRFDAQTSPASTTPTDDLAASMRRAMQTIREWKDGPRAAGHAHAILYKALERHGLPVYESEVRDDPA